MKSCSALAGGYRAVVVATLLLVAVGSRLCLANLGFNRDVESYVVVAKIMGDGENVYAGTARYNYGPVWFYVVHAVAVTASAFVDSWTAFLLLLALMLTIVDLTIAGVLKERVSGLAATLFLINPISIIISGFHRQFDNIAILLAMVAVLLIERSRSDRIDLPFVAAVATLGLSLSVKHVCFAFPLWLAVKEESWSRRIGMLLVPPSLFLLGFLPFWADGKNGIIENVFLYRSLSGAPLLRSVFGPGIEQSAGPLALFLVAMLLGAWICRRRDRFHGLLVYSVTLVAFSPAVANQYLAIPVAAASTFLNPPFVAYSLIAGVHLALNPGETGPFLAPTVAAQMPDLCPALVLLLLAGLAWEMIKNRSRRPNRPPNGPSGRSDLQQ